MGSLTKPYTFSPATYAVASQVDSDFDTLYSWVNTNAIWADASTAFTATPSGPGADPTSANQFSRKQYVDQFLHIQSTSGGTRLEAIVHFWSSVTPNGSGDFTITLDNGGFSAITDLVIPVSANTDVAITLTAQPTKTQWSGRARNLATNNVVTTAISVGYLAIGH